MKLLKLRRGPESRLSPTAKCAAMRSLAIWSTRLRASINSGDGPFLFAMRRAKNWFCRGPWSFPSCGASVRCARRSSRICARAPTFLARPRWSARSRRLLTTTKRSQPALIPRLMPIWLISSISFATKCRNWFVLAARTSRLILRSTRHCLILSSVRDTGSAEMTRTVFSIYRSKWTTPSSETTQE